MGSRQLEFLGKLQKFTANAMISQSAVRNVGAGAKEVASTYAGTVDLGSLKHLDDAQYANWLNLHTDELTRQLGLVGRGKWGNARKVMNIFMRSAAYTQPLAEAFHLANLLPYLEVPLDKYVGEELTAQPEGEKLPRWDAIVRLTPEVSHQYQEAATAVARRYGVYRADLDVFYWQPEK